MGLGDFLPSDPKSVDEYIDEQARLALAMESRQERIAERMRQIKSEENKASETPV